MDYAFAAANIIISRSGAGTISELCLVGKPVILIPSPNVAEDHQTKNAMALSEKNAAVLLPDNMIMKNIVNEAVSLVNDKERGKLLSANISNLAEKDADIRIAQEVIKLIR
jgi:UDP-N-acetylglucosamine--N-acetylmuramyl-(pentapeptide) pyrophosphoryl-undecaprenol N-acetylglucosamine transferase